MVLAQAESFRMVGVARVPLARASMQNAQAADEWARALQAKILLDRLAHELRHVCASEHAANIRVRNIHRHAAGLANLIVGDATASTWQPWR